MSYTFNVVFTGILGFVPHPDKTGALVLAPDALNGTLTAPGTVFSSASKPQALDGEELRRHFAIVRIPGEAAGLHPNDHLIHYLDRERLRFAIPREGGEAGGWALDTTHIISMPGVSDHHEVDPDALKSTPSARVRAQILLEGGSVRGINPGSAWEIRPVLSRNPPPGPYAHEVLWSVPGVTGNVKLVYEPLDGGDPVEYELAGDRGDVTLHIANVCEDNPLQWTMEGSPELRDDIDFRWHFELLSPASRAAIQAALPGKGGKLPVPVLVGQAPFMPGGGNCMTVVHEETAYTI